MSDLIRKKLAPVARRMEMERLIRLSGQRDIFPFYHVVSGFHLPHVRHLYRYRREDEFERDLEEMLHWFEPIGFGEYLEGESRSNGAGRGKRKRRMALSFDDGLAECHQVIAPVLKRKGVPATFFLNNHFIDNRGLFYRYKASLIADRIISECKAREAASEYLKIPEAQVVRAVLMVRQDQQALLDELARKVDLNFVEYLREQPVYMNSQQVREMIDWGFEIGGHSPDHADFSLLGPGEITGQITTSLDDLQQRFGVTTRYFSFPFTSNGIPRELIHNLVDERVVELLVGTAGLKKTGRREFVQRIPVESLEVPSMDVLRTEYLYYLLKMPLGRNTLRY